MILLYLHLYNLHFTLAGQKNNKHKVNTVGTKDTIIDLSSELKYQLHLPLSPSSSLSHL